MKPVRLPLEGCRWFTTCRSDSAELRRARGSHGWGGLKNFSGLRIERVEGMNEQDRAEHAELVEAMAEEFMKSARNPSNPPRDQRLRAAQTAANLGPETLEDLAWFLLALEEDEQNEARCRAELVESVVSGTRAEDC